MPEAQTSPSTLQGSCLCGEVRYQVEGPLDLEHHCHCSRCRRIHGTAFGSFARAARERFHWTHGAKRVRRFAGPLDVDRTFCSRCGAKLTFESRTKQAELWICLGTLDSDPGFRKFAHIWTGSKAPWYEIRGGEPQFEKNPLDG